MPTPIIRPFVLGEFATNCHVVSVPAGGAAASASTSGVAKGAAAECWIVDAGYEPQALLEAIRRDGLSPRAIVLTHCHCDHIAGLDLVRRSFPGIPVYAHEAERGFCERPEFNLSAFLGSPVSVEEPTHWLRGGEELLLAGERFRVLHVPGHSPGGIALVHDASGQAIVGDTLFAGSMGRVDFPTSDPTLMCSSLQRLLALPDATRIFPGHGPSTTVGAERRGNPFVRELGVGGAR